MLLLEVAAAPLVNPSQEPTNGGPSMVMGSSNPGLTNRFPAAGTNDAAKATDKAAVIARQFLSDFMCNPSKDKNNLHQPSQYDGSPNVRGWQSPTRRC